MQENEKMGCDLRAECGFYCAFMQGKSKVWAVMVQRYCNGSDYLLCARRVYFQKTGFCAPLDMTPVGYLSDEILADLQKDE